MQITVNGQPYPDWASIPDDLRTQLAASQPDTNGSGVPDAFEGEGNVTASVAAGSVSVAGSRSTSTSTTSSSVTVGGQDVTAEVTGFFKKLFRR